jgi:hypothetical protein
MRIRRFADHRPLVIGVVIEAAMVAAIVSLWLIPGWELRPEPGFDQLGEGMPRWSPSGQYVAWERSRTFDVVTPDWRLAARRHEHLLVPDHQHQRCIDHGRPGRAHGDPDRGPAGSRRPANDRLPPALAMIRGTLPCDSTHKRYHSISLAGRT